MNNRAIFAAVAIAFLGTSAAAAGAEGEGSYCKVADIRVDNPSNKLVQRKVWEYGEATLHETPVMGWIDIACTDRGIPTRNDQDFGKRIWFSISGPDGAPASKGTLRVIDGKLMSQLAASGASIQGLAFYGRVSPQHACTYTVAVWGASCQGH